MSTWTHITGSLRIDRFDQYDEDIDFGEIFKISTFPKYNKECNMPEGTEGSLNYSVYMNPDNFSASKYCVSFFGDLRNFGKDDVHIVKHWWSDTLGRFDIIRQGVLQIKCEDYNKDIILTEEDK